ncbi:hypothetical protein ABZY03_17590 [Streptomyces klenkii]|uniref:hypothetical protein n=1 Tax=Streptomyces klenkii TaxID=1420899 RepID=UPI0033ACBE82
MNIEVVAVIDDSAGLVSFTSPVGSAWGTWRGSESPEPGRYHVELEIEAEPYPWVPSASGPPRVEGTGTDGTRQIRITGVVASMDDDSVMSLRVGSDIVLVEFPDGSAAPCPGRTVEFTVAGIGIYPYAV